MVLKQTSSLRRIRLFPRLARKLPDVVDHLLIPLFSPMNHDVMNSCPVKHIQIPRPVLFAVGAEQLELADLLAASPSGKPNSLTRSSASRRSQLGSTERFSG